ncbi:MAG: hypothetical protein LBF97_00155 [Elusimicrobiota bacterium]|jgi:hypothetical protein|nr:hypothetical protein [Elusimicrobiota bacterium]
MKFDDIILLTEWKEDLEKGNVLVHGTNLNDLINILEKHAINISQNEWDAKEGISFSRKDVIPIKSNNKQFEEIEKDPRKFVEKKEKSLRYSSFPVYVEIELDKVIGSKENRRVKKPQQINEGFGRGLEIIVGNMQYYIDVVEKDTHNRYNHVRTSSLYKTFKNNLIDLKHNRNIIKILRWYLVNKDEIFRMFYSIMRWREDFNIYNIKSVLNKLEKDLWREERIYQNIFLKPSYTNIYFDKTKMVSLEKMLNIRSMSTAKIKRLQNAIKSNIAFFKNPQSDEIIEFILEYKKS